MGRSLAFLYGLVAYAVFLVSFLYAIGFVGNIVVPKSIDGVSAHPLGTALLIDALLLGLFAVQHSIMARPWFKKGWTKIVPQPIERSTFVLIASLILLLLYAQWQPIGTVIWQVDNAVGKGILQALFWFGWLIVLTATFMVGHFDLFGLRQVGLYLQKRPYEWPKFTKRVLYRWIRHPIMAGFIIAFWSTPTMTLGHLVFAIATTGYILVGIALEERDLVGFHGDVYRQYRKDVPMLFPSLKKNP